MSVAFSSTPEQTDLRAIVRDFCERTAPQSRVREWMASSLGYDQAVWSRLGGELGILGLGIPEDIGGSGGGAVERAGHRRSSATSSASAFLGFPTT